VSRGGVKYVIPATDFESLISASLEEFQLPANSQAHLETAAGYTVPISSFAVIQPETELVLILSDEQGLNSKHISLSFTIFLLFLPEKHPTFFTASLSSFPPLS